MKKVLALVFALMFVTSTAFAAFTFEVKSVEKREQDKVVMMVEYNWNGHVKQQRVAIPVTKTTTKAEIVARIRAHGIAMKERRLRELRLDSIKASIVAEIGNVVNVE